MSAHVARLNPHRLRDKENPTVQMEWVKREVALLVECEWDWTTEREEAFAFEDYAAAEGWIHAVRGAERERGEDYFYGAYACTASPQHPTSNIDPSSLNTDGGSVSLRSAQHPTSKDTHAGAVSASPPRGRKAGTVAEGWVFPGRMASDEVYAATVRRVGS